MPQLPNVNECARRLSRMMQQHGFGTNCPSVLPFFSCSLVLAQVVGSGFVVFPLCAGKAAWRHCLGQAERGKAQHLLGGIRKKLRLFPVSYSAGCFLFESCSLFLRFCSGFSLVCLCGFVSSHLLEPKPWALRAGQAVTGVSAFGLF